MKTAVLLINLGTPNALDLKSMKTYLAEFLMDGRVLKIPKALRWILVNLIIVPFRARANLKNYGKIWMKEGSPLMVYANRLSEGIKAFFDGKYAVEVAMRYQEPSIDGKISQLVRQGYTRIVVVPLYPQYASATTGSVAESVCLSLQKKWHVPSVEFMAPFYHDELYLDAVAKVSAKYLREPFDHYVFSYHGLPVKHLQIGETGAKHCKGNDRCCLKKTDANAFCYRAQCVRTTRGLVAKLKLDPKKVTTCFQSRFGNDPWIQPFTTEVLVRLAKKKKKRVAVLCPAFVADCIETLEEINIGEKENFIEAGGENLTMIPCLNDSPVWIENLGLMLRRRFQL